MSQAETLLNYMPIIVRSSVVTDWERKFCASMTHKNRTGRFQPSEKQIGVMQRIVTKFQNETMRDEPLVDGGHDER